MNNIGTNNIVEAIGEITFIALKDGQAEKPGFKLTLLPRGSAQHQLPPLAVWLPTAVALGLAELLLAALASEGIALPQPSAPAKH